MSVWKQWRIQGFPEGGANSQNGCANQLFCNFFAKNCIKMKEFGLQGDARPWRPLPFDPPMGRHSEQIQTRPINQWLPMVFLLFSCLLKRELSADFTHDTQHKKKDLDCCQNVIKNVSSFASSEWRNIVGEAIILSDKQSENENLFLHDRFKWTQWWIYGVCPRCAVSLWPKNFGKFRKIIWKRPLSSYSESWISPWYLIKTVNHDRLKWTLKPKLR